MSTITIQAPYHAVQSHAARRLIGPVTGGAYIADGLGRIVIDTLDLPDFLAKGFLLSASAGGGGSGTQFTITTGATIGSPYVVGASVGRVLANKSVGAATYVQLPLAGSMGAALASGVLVKDIKGDASTHNITIQFSGGELCDGDATVVIGTDYGWSTVNPIPGGGGWYRS